MNTDGRAFAPLHPASIRVVASVNAGFARARKGSRGRNAEARFRAKVESAMKRGASEGFVGRIAPFLLAFVVGAPFLVVRYGLTDDYSMLMLAIEAPSRMTREIAEGARLLYGPLRETAARLAGSVDGLVGLRAAGLAGLGLFAWTVRSALVREGWAPGAALAVATLILATPSASVLGGWATCWPYPFAAALAAGAFYAADAAAEAVGARRVGKAASSLVAVTASAWIYQPAAFGYLAPLLGRVLARAERGEALSNARWIVGHLAWLAAALAFAYLGARGALAAWGIEGSFRLALVRDPLDKLEWAATSLIPNTVNFFTLRGHRGEGTALYLVLAAAVAALPVLRAVALARAKGPRVAAVAAVGIALSLAASWSLLLIIRESYASYRVLLVPVTLVVLLFVWSLWIAPGGADRRFLKRAVQVVAVAALAVAAHRNWTLIAKPQAEELAIMEKALQEAAANDSEDPLYVVQPRLDDTLARFVSTNEFGLPSAHTDWAVQGMVWQWRRAQGLPTRLPPRVEYGRAASEEPRTEVIDLPARFGNRGTEEAR